MMTIRPVIAVAIFLAAVSLAQDHDAGAGDEPWGPIPATPMGSVIGNGASPDIHAGEFSVQMLAGFSASSGLGPNADFDYELIILRGGVVLLPDHQPVFAPKGDVTCLLDLMIARPDDFGSIVTGPSVLLRKDLRPSVADLIPYIQVGGGMVYTDADNAQTQRIIGRSWEFLLQGGLGCHYRITEQWMLDMEGSYQHISNAQLAGRNLGTNNLGIVVGFTRTLGPPSRQSSRAGADPMERLRK
jgi:lipid A 3-O-deacylase